jgi:hypothetical protein
LQPSDGLNLEIGTRFKGQLPSLSIIQKHVSCPFPLAIDTLGLRQSGSRLQISIRAQNYPKQFRQDRQPTFLGTGLFLHHERGGE